jgi:ribonuclease E
MLDSEPDNNAVTNPVTTPDAAPKPPRRRAASRPAGPPKHVDPVAETTGGAAEITLSAPQQSLPEQPADGDDATPAKKTAARKTAAKKAPVKKAAAEKPAEKSAAKKTTTRRTAKKTAAADPADAVTPEPAAQDQAELPAVSESEAEQAPAKKSAAKRTAKKTTTKAPAKRAPRKTAAKKTAAPGTDLSGADLTGADPTDAGLTTPVEQGIGAVDADEAAELVESQQAAEVLAVEETAGTEAPTVQATETEATTSEEPATDRIAEAVEAAETLEEAEEIESADEADLSIEAAIASAMSATLAEREAAQADDTDDAHDEDAHDEDAHDEGDETHEGGRRRRRRRGGRRRRRGGRDRDSAEDDESSEESGEASGEDAGSVEAADGPAAEAAPAAADSGDRSADQSGEDAEGATDEDTEGEGGGGRRRRRRRRRRGEDTAAAPDDPTEVVVRVREPRKASDEVTGIDGSTRMEAKRQRRREGREAGRRRAPIISEAEFLARRESVNRKMIIRQRDDLSQIAVLEDGILVEHYVDRESANSLIGNVYLGRVQNVLPSMEAAFIDIGRGRNAVLYAGEVDWDSYGVEGHDRKVETVLKSGQTVLVQVTKDPVGAKGARLTNHVSIPGRYVVYAPNGHLSGISRKLPENERKRLKDILDAAVGETASVIVRTAAEGASEEELTRDVNRLKAQWEDIERKVKAGNAPQLLYAEPDLTLRIVRDLFTEDFAELIVQGNGSMNDAYEALEAYMQHVAPHLADRMKRWDAEQNGDLFGSYRLDEQIAKGLERKVFLPSGGSLIIDRTEAMTVIDVNTGKFTGSGGNLEATITSNNLEAAEEIVRQLRLRDIGGIIVIDFIDMVLPSNRELLLRRLVECLGRDRTRHQVAEVTSLGLVQMTRKRIGTGLLEAFSTECPHCHGRGVELHDVPVADAKLADGGARDEHNGGGNRNRRRGGKGRKKSGDEAPAEVPAAS